MYMCVRVNKALANLESLVLDFCVLTLFPKVCSFPFWFKKSTCLQGSDNNKHIHHGYHEPAEVLILATVPWDSYYYYLHFTYEKTEPKGGLNNQTSRRKS